MPAKQNILWIQCDELRTDALGCYGGDNLTPHIDALAAEGAVFENHFTTSPVCVPARVSELTGCYPCQTGILENSVHYNWGKWPEGLNTFPECFLAEGYATANFGKYHTPHHGTWGENWHFCNFEEVGDYFGLREGYDEEAAEILHRGNRKRDVVLSGRYPLELSPTVNVTDHTLQWLRYFRGIRRPFFARASFLAPHTPVMVPEPYYSMYDQKEYDWDVPDEQVLSGLPNYENGQLEAYRTHTPEEYQRMRRTYYGLVTHIDDQVGRLVQQLKEQGEYDNTVIIFTSDHGDLMGEYGQFQKGMFYDVTSRVPCIIKAPGITPGSRISRLTECIDIGPTLLALCGLPPHGQSKGQDMLGSNKREVFGEIFLGGVRRSCLRTAEYCLDITTALRDRPAASEEYDGKLTDLKNDPLFHCNLYGKPEYANMQAELTERLFKRMAEDARPLQFGQNPNRK